MKQLLAVVLIGFVLIGLVGIIIVPLVFSDPIGLKDSPPVTDATGVVSTTQKIYTTRPLTRDEATGRLRLVELPPEANEVQFAGFAFWQANEFVMTFRAPTDICLAYATAVLESHNAKDPRNQVSTLFQAISAVERVRPNPREVPAPWFTPEAIRNGAEAGGDDSHQPKVWVDVERGIFYYQYMD